MNTLTMPPEVEKKLEDLYKLCEANPVYLSPAEVAKFLGAKPDGLRSSIELGHCPFGIMWKLGTQRICKIPTATFYLWYTNGIGYRGYTEC